MGLPQIDITFSTLAVSAVQRSQRGIVALILRDDTTGDVVNEYKIVTDVVADEWTSDNYDYIKQAFKGVPSKVIVIRGATTDTDYTDQLSLLESKKFNWLAIPEIETVDSSTVASWIGTMRDNGNMFKAVLPNEAADSEAIVNFTTEGIVVGLETYTASEYTARMAGIFAGLALDRSATYYELAEVDDFTESSDPGADVDAGKLILIKQDGKIKIARGVNSLVTTSTEKSAIFKKIKIVEGMDLIKTDIQSTFNDEYVGKVNNSYDNQVLFITAVMAYMKGLEGDVLDPNYDNTVGIDVEAQRLAWEGIGTDTTEWDEQDVKENAFQSNVYLDGNLKFLDAMEDLTMSILLV
jgi:hypothetical protein